MISIISGTVRANNNTHKVAKQTSKILDKLGADNQILDLRDLPKDFIYNNEAFGDITNEFSEIVDKYFKSVDKFIFITPEYNGGFPGPVKALIDGVQPKHFHGKKSSLIGLSAGRIGNTRGMDQLTNVLNYLQVTVMPQKLALIHVGNLIDEQGEINEENALQFLNEHAELISKF